MKNNTSNEYSDKFQFTWLAKLLEGTYEKPDATSANGVAATVAVTGMTLATPGGAKGKMAKELSAGEKFFEGTTLHPRVLKQLKAETIMLSQCLSMKLRNSTAPL